MSEFVVKISNKRTKKPGTEYAGYGNVVGLQDDGTFWVNGYDGSTLLSPSEAIELANVLILWAEKNRLSVNEVD